MHFPQQVQHRAKRIFGGGYITDATDHRGRTFGSKVTNRGDYQLGLGTEVVYLGTAGHAGDLGDARRGGSVVSVADQAVDSGVQQTLPGLGAALLLGSPGGGTAGRRRDHDRRYYLRSAKNILMCM